MYHVLCIMFIVFPNMPCTKRVYGDKWAPVYSQQPGTNSGRRFANTPVTDRGEKRLSNGCQPRVLVPPQLT